MLHEELGDIWWSDGSRQRNSSVTQKINDIDQAIREMKEACTSAGSSALAMRVAGIASPSIVTVPANTQPELGAQPTNSQNSSSVLTAVTLQSKTADFKSQTEPGIMMVAPVDLRQVNCEHTLDMVQSGPSGSYAIDSLPEAAVAGALLKTSFSDHIRVILEEIKPAIRRGLNPRCTAENIVQCFLTNVREAFISDFL